MIVVVQAGSKAGKQRALLEEAYRLRYRIFVEEQGWNELASTDGRECDAVDEDGAVHFLALRGGGLCGYARLMPPEGLAPGLRSPRRMAALAARPGILGIGRLCVVPELRGGPKARSIAAELFLAICDHALAEGRREIFAETDPAFHILLRLVGFKVGFVGKPERFHGRRSLLAIIGLDARALDHCRLVLRTQAAARPGSPKPEMP